MLNIRKLIAAVLLCCMALSGALAEEPTVMGNDKAGYLTANEQYYDFVSSNVDPESIVQAEQLTGYCQYFCAEGPCAGMIITMSGYHASQLMEGGDELDHLNVLANHVIEVAKATTYRQIAYEVQLMYFSETSGMVLITMRDDGNTENPNVMFGVIPFNGTNQYGLYYFEQFPLTEEAVAYIVDLVSTFHF